MPELLTEAAIGFHGKLPARGDFVQAGLPRSFTEPWDEWMQRMLTASRAALGEAWTAAWLEAAVWRFVLSPGICGPGVALGLFLPSVDRVGRYYPLTLAAVAAGGNSAALMRAGQFSQITHDHSLVQEMLDTGAISAAEAAGHPRANVITRALGAGDETPCLDKITDRLRGGDRFLLCSDGLSKTLAEHTIAEFLGAGEDAADLLLSAALERQADDNVTAVTVEVLPQADPC